MKYYRVIGKYDNTQVLRVNRRTGRLENHGEILVGNELYTPGELRRLMENAKFRGNGINGNTAIFEAVEIPKNKTYWYFGARFSA